MIQGIAKAAITQPWAQQWIGQLAQTPGAPIQRAVGGGTQAAQLVNMLGSATGNAGVSLLGMLLGGR